MAYGFVRKIDDVVNAYVSVREWNKDEREYFERRVPMLLVDRVAVLGISTLASPYLLPKYIYDDISWWELYMRKADGRDYGRDKPKRSVIDYMF